MSSVKVTVKSELNRVLRAMQAGNKRVLHRAGGYLRGIARRKIRRSKKYAEAGAPPNTRKGNLKNAIVYAVAQDLQSVVVGPANTRLASILRTHESGGTEGPKPGAKPNFVMAVGGHGPIRNEGPNLKSGLAFTKFVSPLQVVRAMQIAAMLTPRERGGGAAKTRRYPPRPVLGPTLADGKAALPSLWANSVQKG